MYSEIKYDGERVQVHKKGNEFRYFSRSLKPVLPHKVRGWKDGDCYMHHAGNLVFFLSLSLSLSLCVCVCVCVYIYI